MAGIFDVVAYDFKGDRLCGPCVITQVPTGAGEAYDGWADATGTMGAEEFLQGIAEAFGIDRMIEDSFSTSEFPKVVFRGHVGGTGATCDKCGTSLELQRP